VTPFSSFRNPRFAFAVTALVGCVWLNQGPSIRRCKELTNEAAAPDHPFLRAWLPIAFAYQRSTDEELYFATANAMRGEPYDEDLLRAKRGATSKAFERFPAPDGRWHWPYLEVPLEYPALVLPFIALPAAVASSFGAFAVFFGVSMAALMLVAVALAIGANPGSTREDRATQWWLAAGLFLAQGGLLAQRVDAVAAVFLALALWAAAGRRPFLLGLAVALAASAKILPALVLLPLMAADRRALGSKQAVAKVATGLALGLAFGILPMVVLSPSAFLSFVDYHRARGLHVESTYGAIVSLVDLAGGGPRGATLSFGSFNLSGATADILAGASTFLLVLSVLALTVHVARLGAPGSESIRVNRIACAGLAALSLVWLFAKVFSPQYMTWAIPFAVLASDRRIPALLIAAMAITQTYLRGFYDQVVDMRLLGVVALEVRLVVLVLTTILAIRALSGSRRVQTA
jgi:uncharacterized membrane protein